MPDWPGVGRSGFVASADLTGELVCEGLAQLLRALATPVIVLTHSMSCAYGWRLLERCGDGIAGLVAIAPAPPGNIQPEATVEWETADSIRVLGTTSYTLDPHAPFVPTEAFVLTKLIGAGARFPRETVGRYPASLSAIPPRLLLQRLNLRGSQLEVRTPAPYAASRLSRHGHA